MLQICILIVFLDINWGTSTEANRYRKALSGLIKVSRQTAHVKTYRPQLLVLTGNPIARQALVDFCNSIAKGTNLLVCGHVIPVSFYYFNFFVIISKFLCN